MTDNIYSQYAVACVDRLSLLAGHLDVCGACVCVPVCLKLCVGLREKCNRLSSLRRTRRYQVPGLSDLSEVCRRLPMLEVMNALLQYQSQT